ncbi:hypothetical protein DPM19_09710 [Actinomadura craniellae]|uniref:Uncharacterized protein n=1 Tax=Actinomadura craniellae TaxID=2231787 RepID=A0A365H7F9_9ACTN|nr:hypothetical protein [Actinomadura craniellae]RAY15017.1 hypothetical protein DPM19_09710 [Actinomadura craniellae]
MRHITALIGRQILDTATVHLAAILPGHTRRSTHRLADDYGHPHGAGAIGPGADGLLRAVLVEALTTAPGPVEVLITHHDLEHLFGEMTDRVPLERFHNSLRVTDTLENAVEHVEERANGTERQKTPILWMATPGADADVVHQTLESCPAALLTALFKGPWPYGPTHVIEENGPRPRPHQPVSLLSPRQAVARLHATIPGA